jgi:predicted DNA-binding helix-hairpin-helix protein
VRVYSANARDGKGGVNEHYCENANRVSIVLVCMLLLGCIIDCSYCVPVVGPPSHSIDDSFSPSKTHSPR